MIGIRIKDSAKENFRAVHDILRNNGSGRSDGKVLDAVKHPKIGLRLTRVMHTYKHLAPQLERINEMGS
jgi:hypothetical protein